MAKATQTGEVLGTRALNRALLSRQMLLRRERLPAIDVIERFVGLQAQNPLDPYYGLWSRVAGFRPGELARLITERSVVRAPIMRGTVHVVSADDALTLWPLVQPLFARVLQSTAFGKGTAGMNLDALVTAATALMEERPRTAAELGKLLRERWPDRDPQHLAYSVHYRAPLVQAPPRGIWGKAGQATWTTIPHWLGRPLASNPSVDEMVMRYFAAFGPATASDVRAWSNINGLRDVVERLRPRLVTFRDEKGRELFDLPDAPRPDPRTPSPPRFLPEYDNVFLSHADCARIGTEEASRLWADRRVANTVFLVNGFIAGTWKIERLKSAATIVIAPFKRISKRDGAALSREGVRLLKFAAPGVAHDLRLVVSE